MNKYEQISDIQARRRVFLDDTIAFYNSGNRAVVMKDRWKWQSCVYRATDTSPGCAIGRHLPKDHLLCEHGMLALKSVWNREVFNRLPLWMTRMGQEFLIAIQELHDNADYWTAQGLSPSGRRKVFGIEQCFGLSEPKEKY